MPRSTIVTDLRQLVPLLLLAACGGGSDPLPSDSTAIRTLAYVVTDCHGDETGTSWSQKLQILRGKRFELLDRHKKNRVFPEKLAEVAAQSVLLFRGIHQKDLETHGALSGARIFYSLWEGYLKQKSGLELQAWADAHSVPLQPLHTSGHASPADLKRFAAGLNPKVLVPIHSFMPEAYGQLFPRVEAHDDGEWWMLDRAN